MHEIPMFENARTILVTKNELAHFQLPSIVTHQLTQSYDVAWSGPSTAHGTK